MANAIKLIGLDFGTTTSSAIIATAQLAHNVVTGRSEITQVIECYRSDMIFTPVAGDLLDLKRLTPYLDDWLQEAAVLPGDLFGGGAILTGLTAQKANAEALVQTIHRRLSEPLIAVADDPCFESWLAFMGSCLGLSRANPDRPVINLDIGGGTTNLAFGQRGQVFRTGSLFAGARHVQLEPGTYRLVHTSNYATALFDYLDIRKCPGNFLEPHEVDRIVTFYIQLIRAAAAGDTSHFENPICRRHLQTPWVIPRDSGAIVTLSGGVAELVYAHVRGESWPPVTCYGDLGIDLARRLVEVPEWRDHFQRFIPTGGGRALVLGLLRHSTQVSGSTIFLPDPAVLPLRNLPIVGSIDPDSTDAEIDDRVHVAARSSSGAALTVRFKSTDHTNVQMLGRKLAASLIRNQFPAKKPLALVVDCNVGKALGNCITDWGRIPVRLIVVDELNVRDAQFVQLGKLHDQILPVSFFGVAAPAQPGVSP
jgi:ethanolamine utilization protein EutA